MKFSQTSILAILASTACVSAAPAAVVTENSLVTRGDANEILDLLNDLKQVNEKRDLVSDSEQMALSKRADSLVTELVAALASSGIIADVWDTLTQDEALKSEIVGIVKSTVKAALVQGPALIKAVWDSGLITKLFKDIINDSQLRSVLFEVAKSIFKNGLNLLKTYKTKSSDDSDAGVSTNTDGDDSGDGSGDGSGGDTSNIPSPSEYNSGSKRDFIDGEYLNKRDMASMVTTVAQQVKDSGLVSSLIKKVMADPEKSIAFLTNILKSGFVIAEDLFQWAKESGTLEKGLKYLEKNGGDYTGEIASFLGGQIDSGNVSTSDIDNAGSASTTDTVIATTAVTAAAPAATTLQQVRRSAY